MKIGFDAKRIFHNTTGLGNYGRDLVSILASYYPNHKYLLYNPSPKKVNRLAVNTPISEHLPSSFFWRFFSSIWRQGPIVNQLKKDSIDLFHGLSGEIPKGIENTQIKTIVTVHDLIFIRYPKLYSFIDQKIHFKKVKNAVVNADKVIAISEQTKRDILTYLPVEESKIEVVYQGCHQVFKEPKEANFKEEVLKRYQLPSEFILNVGTINERKNLLSLVKAIKDINVSLVVVGGKTKYYQQIEEYIEEHQLQSKIFVIQGLTLDELAALYQQAKLFVYPSIFEGFGIPIIEALYSKTPVISSTGSCFAEAGGPNSIYVAPNDIKALIQNIKLVLKDEELQKVMIMKGFEYVQQFNDEEIARDLMEIYNKV